MSKVYVAPIALVFDVQMLHIGRTKKFAAGGKFVWRVLLRAKEFAVVPAAPPVAERPVIENQRIHQCAFLHTSSLLLPSLPKRLDTGNSKSAPKNK